MRKFAFLIIMWLAAIPCFTGAAQVTVAPFDKFGEINCEDEMARLDNFAIQLQSQPDSKAYIIFYGGRRRSSSGGNSSLPRHGEAEARAARLKPYLVDRRGVDAGRVVVINGGYRETFTVELWILPKEAGSPKPTPTVRPQKIRFSKGKARARDYRCSV